jgi:hypothetical protein
MTSPLSPVFRRLSSSCWHSSSILPPAFRRFQICQHRYPILDALLLALHTSSSAADLAGGPGLTGVVPFWRWCMATPSVALAAGVGRLSGIANDCGRTGMPPCGDAQHVGLPSGVVATNGESVAALTDSPGCMRARGLHSIFDRRAGWLCHFHFLLYHTRFGNYIRIGGIAKRSFLRVPSFLPVSRRHG